METQKYQTEVLDLSQTIEIIDTSDGGPSQVANKICGGAPCGFSDAASTSKDAKERYASMKKLMLVVILCIIFMSVEVVGGIKANSLAILTDAAHLLSDVASFAISLFSLWAAGWEATPRLSYGFFRIEILGALVSIQLIWLLTGILVYEAFDRLVHDSGEVQGFLMFVVAAFGLIVNIIMTVMLGHEHAHGGHSHDHGHHGHVHEHTHHNIDTHNHHDITISTIDHHGHHDERQPLLKHSEDTAHHGHVHEHTHHNIDTHNHHDITISTIDHHGHHDERQPLLKHSEDTTHSNNFKKERNINVQGAYLHVLGDLIQSAGVMIGGAFIWYKPEWKIIDLICTLIFSLIVLWTTIRMLRNILEVLMESTPREIDATRLEKGLCEMDDVIAVHEMHIWAITVGKVLLSCHVTITSEADATLVLDKVIGYIKREYNISHVTIQIERE